MPTKSASPSRAKTARAYHHGDLRSALVRSALELLHTEGPDALTLRGAARAAGVSQAAPYRHFADRRALVAAVAEEGFQMLQQAMLDGMHGSDGRPALKSTAVSYVAFGLRHPALYRIMFGAEVSGTSDTPEHREIGRGVLTFVSQGIGQLQSAGLVRAGDPMLIAVTTWASLHGLVMLSLDGQGKGVAPSIDALVEEMTSMLMFGMAPRAGA